MNYLALVGRGTTGYNVVFAPNSPSLGDNGDTLVMSAFTGDTEQLQWRVWLPKGTRTLQATMYVYWDKLPAKALMRIGQPPIGGLNDVTPDNAAAVDSTNVLADLLAGAEVPCYAASEAGAMKLSSGMMDSPIVVHEGCWLYINVLQAPGNKIYKLDTYISVDKAQYLESYAQTVWDGQGNPVAGRQVVVETAEEKLIKRVFASGLVEGLRKLSGAKTDEELIQRVQETGTWAALLKLMG